MKNNTLQLKVQQRLNKLASQDYENIPCWAIVEAFNKGQMEWCRRNLHGLNIVKEGDEQSTSRIDDFQKLITPTSPLTFVDKGIYYESVLSDWPADFLRYKRVELSALHDCCEKPARMKVWLGEEGNIDDYLNDDFRKPNYGWRETFFVFAADKIKIYHNNEFTISEAKLIYYRQPIKIEINGCKDPYTNLIPTVDVECEFNDDLIELLIDEAAAILAGDIESIFEKQRLDQDVEKNN